jgi:hypothetical protein
MQNLPALSSFHSNIDYIERTVAQLQKDFGYYGFDLEFDLAQGDGTPYEILYNQVHPIIEELVDYQYTRLLPVLYRIDISEDQIKATQTMNTEERVSETITSLILTRELQKVVIREHFKQVSIDEANGEIGD